MKQALSIAIICCSITLPACAALSSLLGPAAAAAGAGLGAYEEALEASEKAKLDAKTNAELLERLEKYHSEAAKRASEERARDEAARLRDEAARKKLDRLLAEALAKAKQCPRCPACPACPACPPPPALEVQPAVLDAGTATADGGVS